MLRTLLVFAILVPGFFAALSSRFAGLLLYLWFALFRPQEWVWLDLSALRLSLVLGMLFVVPSLLTGVYPHLAHPISIGAVAFLLASLVAQIDAVNPGVSWAWVDFLFRLQLVCLLAITLIDDQKRFRLALAVIAGSFGFHAAKAGLASLLGGGVRLFDGLAGAYGDNNGYAVGMVMIGPLLLAAGQNIQQKWIARGFLLTAPLTAVATVSTFSRGGFLALMSALLSLAIVQRRRLPALAAIAVFALPLWFFMASQEGYLERLQTIRTYDEVNEQSAVGRLHLWRVAIDIAEDRPLGVGLFGYEAAYNRYDFSAGEFGQNRSVHSSHFQVLAETGILGTIAYVALFILAFRGVTRIRRRSRDQALAEDDRRLFLTSANALMASMVAFLIGGSFVAMALNDLTWLTFALVASLDRISARTCAAANLAEARDPAPRQERLAVAWTWRPAGERAP